MIDRYLKNPLKGEEEKVAQYAWMLKFWNRTLGDYFISEITPALIYQAREKLISNPSHSEKAKNSKQKKYFKPATINRHQAALSSVFNRAVMEWGYVPQSRFTGQKIEGEEPKAALPEKMKLKSF